MPESGGGAVGLVVLAQHAEHGVAEGGEGLGCRAGTDLARVLSQRDSAHLLSARRAGPVLPDQAHAVVSGDLRAAAREPDDAPGASSGQPACPAQGLRRSPGAAPAAPPPSRAPPARRLTPPRRCVGALPGARAGWSKSSAPAAKSSGCWAWMTTS